MEITKTLYVNHRKQWRSWLVKNYKKEKEIWLIYYKKASGKLRIPYDDAVEEALCYGWIDGIVKSIDTEKYAQRFTPRRKNSNLSELNKKRIIKMIKQKKMTKAGLKAVEHAFDPEKEEVLAISNDILKKLKKDKLTWKNFNSFPEDYKRIRINWIEDSRKRPDEFKKRLNYFLKMTYKNKKYGTIVNH